MMPENIEQYLKRTQQTRQELFSGAEFFGMAFISDLVTKANAEEKKIVWKDEPAKGLGAMSYALE